MKNKNAKSLLTMFALIAGIVCSQSAPAQTFKRVLVKGGAPLAQIASGGASVWARASNGKPYILKAGKFVLANNLSLTQLAVGGGNAFQADAVWGLDSSGNIYTATKSGTSWVFSPAPGVLDFIAVGPGYQDSCHPYEVWGLNSAALIYRFNYCIGNWDFVPGTLGTLSVGSGEAWGLNGNGDIFRFDFTTLAFRQVAAPATFDQITVGTNAVFVNKFGGYPLFELTRVGQNTVEGSLIQIQAGGDGVWGLGSSQQIFRLQPFAIGFTQIPGALVSISVGSGGGVWGIDSTGKAYAFSTP
ncbi:MAG: hypothetical protein HY010_10020 [Acidobacteria bacterium]|nr:hypothetical protein [Acidobacteriota bacterium]